MRENRCESDEGAVLFINLNYKARRISERYNNNDDALRIYAATVFWNDLVNNFFDFLIQQTIYRHKVVSQYCYLIEIVLEDYPSLFPNIIEVISCAERVSTIYVKRSPIDHH